MFSRIFSRFLILFCTTMLVGNIYWAITGSIIVPVFLASALLGCILVGIIDLIKEKELKRRIK